MLSADKRLHPCVHVHDWYSCKCPWSLSCVAADNLDGVIRETSGRHTHLESRSQFRQTINIHLGRRSSKYEGLHSHPRTCTLPHAHTHTSPSVQVLLQRLHWRGLFSLTEPTAAGDSDWLPLISLWIKTHAPLWLFRDCRPPSFSSSHCCAGEHYCVFGAKLFS